MPGQEKTPRPNPPSLSPRSAIPPDRRGVRQTAKNRLARVRDTLPRRKEERELNRRRAELAREANLRGKSIERGVAVRAAAGRTMAQTPPPRRSPSPSLPRSLSQN